MSHRSPRRKLAHLTGIIAKSARQEETLPSLIRLGRVCPDRVNSRERLLYFSISIVIAIAATTVTTLTIVPNIEWEGADEGVGPTIIVGRGEEERMRGRGEEEERRRREEGEEMSRRG